MGGGDLNSKKSWHPNTMKNQERVWKVEQAAAEEKKRIMELQHERAAERDRAQLNELAKQTAGSTGANDDRLHWMYDKPDKKVQHEDYLLGKAIDKNYDKLDKPDDVIPAVARRVVGSSMVTTSVETQVDLARKVREDPLLLVKERERAARAALLNNPLQRRKLTELLRKEQEQRKEIKNKKNTKKKNENDLDGALAAKLSALAGNKGIDLAALLASGDSGSDSSSDEEHSKRKKKKKHKIVKKAKKSKERKKAKQSASDIESSDADRRVKKHKTKTRNKKKKKKKKFKELHNPNNVFDLNSEPDDDKRQRPKSKDRHRSKDHSSNRDNISKSKKRRSESEDSDSEVKIKRHKTMEKSRSDEPKRSQRHDHDDEDSRRDTKRLSSQYNARRNDTEQQWKVPRLSEKERAARLEEMAAAGAEREVCRGRRVAAQRADDAAETARRSLATARSEARALPDSLESRIHSNRHYIQRNRSHMNEHFARR